MEFVGLSCAREGLLGKIGFLSVKARSPGKFLCWHGERGARIAKRLAWRGERRGKSIFFLSAGNHPIGFPSKLAGRMQNPAFPSPRATKAGN